MDKSELIVENKPIYSRLIYSAVFLLFLSESHLLRNRLWLREALMRRRILSFFSIGLQHVVNNFQTAAWLKIFWNYSTINSLPKHQVNRLQHIQNALGRTLLFMLKIPTHHSYSEISSLA